jgi:AcrR family transcriptional regulator
MSGATPTAPREARRARLDPEERRAQIVDAAADVFRGRDPATVRFDDVARAAGVSRSLVYAYFGDRGELIAAVHLHTLSDLDVELSSLLADVPEDECRLAHVVRHYFELADRYSASWPLFAAAGAIDHPAVREARDERCRRIAEDWGGGPAEHLLARGLVAALEAAATEWVVKRPCGLDEAADVLTRSIWHGMRGRSQRPHRD